MNNVEVFQRIRESVSFAPFVRGSDLRQYMSEHCENDLKNDWLWRVKEPMKVFKAVIRRQIGQASLVCIVNLELPRGTRIMVNPDCFNGINEKIVKMRADQAFVHSIAEKYTGNIVYKAESDWNWSYVYKPGTLIYPERDSGGKMFPVHQNFDDRQTCATGIHFFVNLAEAFDYLGPGI